MTLSVSVFVGWAHTLLFHLACGSRGETVNRDNRFKNEAMKERKKVATVLILLMRVLYMPQ